MESLKPNSIRAMRIHLVRVYASWVFVLEHPGLVLYTVHELNVQLPSQSTAHKSD